MTIETMKDSADSMSSNETWPLPQRPGFLARRLHQIHVSLFMELCAEFRVTPLQYSLLSALSERGAADQTTLAKAVALDRTTTTGALKRLESRGLVQRVTSAQDRRAQDCRMTPDGAALLAAMQGPARAAHEATVASLGENDRRTLMALLERVVAAHEDRRPTSMPQD